MHLESSAQGYVKALFCTSGFLRRVAQCSDCKRLVLANAVEVCKLCLLSEKLSPLCGVTSGCVTWCHGESLHISYLISIIASVSGRASDI